MKSIDRPRAVILARVSTRKQAISGDTGIQIEECLAFVNKSEWIPAKFFTLVETARSEVRREFDEVINFCLDKKNNISYLVFRDISRFTRGGSDEYMRMKKKLETGGVKIRDIQGTIQDTVNLFENFGVEYSFTRVSPTERQETVEAEEARSAIKKALRLMIGSEIRYTQMGYWSRNSVYGFNNEKIDTDSGERNILVPHEKEASYICQMFEMKASGQHTDEAIVKELNDSGFKTRKFKKRDPKNKKKVIGHGGENPLDKEKLKKYLQRLAYAGIVCEKWTHDQPVKAKFEGLVSPELFNQANEGEIEIVELDDSNVEVKYKAKSDLKKKRRSKHNPMYPFKNVVLCPICKQTLQGSASRGKLGDKYPAYHCSKGHKLWRIPRDEFHSTVYEFLWKLNFTKQFTQLFEEVVMQVWRSKRLKAVEVSKKAEVHVSELLTKQESVLQAITAVESQTVRKKLEKDYESLERQIKGARVNRGQKERSELEIKRAIKYVVYLMEHFEELLVHEENAMQQQQLFGLIFEKFPTYDQLVNGTPKLTLAFSLNKKSKSSKSVMVTPQRIELWLPG